MEQLSSNVTSFTVFCSGQIEWCEMVGKDNLYCRYVVIAGRDWECIEGQTEGISQISKKSSGESRQVVWNFPLDFVYTSTNAFGWPQIILSVSYIDQWGKDVICGYGRMHLPVSPGRYDKRMHLFTPIASSWVQELAAWMAGTPPEFTNFKFLADGEGREAVRVASEGHVKVQFNIVTRNMRTFGYSDGLGKTSFEQN